MADEFVGSHEQPFPTKSKTGYGQNGSTQSSSLFPGQSKPNIPDVSPPTVKANAGDWQTRNVSSEPIKPAHGMKARDSKSSIPDANVRRVTTRK